MHEVRKNIDLSLELSNNVTYVFGSEVAIKQSFINLAVNSVEAAKAGGKIVIRSKLLDGTVYLEVEDNGPGIPFILQEEASLFSALKGSPWPGIEHDQKADGGN